MVLLSVALAVPVEVDPDVELVSVVFRLAGAPEYTQSIGPHAEATDAWFEDHRSHAAVRTARRLGVRRGIAYNAPIDLAVRLDDELRVSLDPWPVGLDDRWTRRSANRWLRKLRAFADDADFAGFWAERADYIDAVEQSFTQAPGADSAMPWLQQTFGLGPSSARIIPGLLVGPNNYGASVQTPTQTVFTPVLGLGRTEDGLPKLDERTADLLVHELAHGVVNPALEAHQDLLQLPGQALYAMKRDTMKRQAYGDWRIVMNETVVRATTVLYVHDTRGPDAAGEVLRYEQGRGFVWVEPVVRLLHAARQGGSLDLHAVAPQLAETLDAWVEAPPPQPFGGPINAVFDHRGPQMTVVAPAQGPIHDYAKTIWGQFFRSEDVAFGQEPTAASPTIHYGTADALATVLQAQGWSMDADGVSLGSRRVDIPNPVLVACGPHPDNPQVPVLVYAGWREDDLVGVNNLFHGPTDWMVATPTETGLEMVASGHWGAAPLTLDQGGPPRGGVQGR